MFMPLRSNANVYITYNTHRSTLCAMHYWCRFKNTAATHTHKHKYLYTNHCRNKLRHLASSLNWKAWHKIIKKLLHMKWENVSHENITLNIPQPTHTVRYVNIVWENVFGTGQC